VSSLYDIPLDSFTAQLVVSEREAYVAVSRERRPHGPNGEPRIAVILHTADAGREWKALTWRRSFLSRLRYPAFPNWPPEAVMGMSLDGGRLRIVHRDEHVIFEPGGESLWESTLQGANWSLRRIRRMEYDGGDRSAAMPRIALQLPPSMKAPTL